MTLDSIRERLSAADAALVEALAARQRLVAEVAEVKASGTGALRDVAREKFPAADVREFTSGNVAQSPIVLVGTHLSSPTGRT